MNQDAQPKRRVGRKTVFTEELADKIVGLIRIGNFIEVACLAAGIHKSTYYEWKVKGAAGEEPFATFLDNVKEAEAVMEATLVGHVYEACRGKKEHAKTWQQNLRLLACRFSDRWAARPMEPKAPGDGTQPVAMRILVDNADPDAPPKTEGGDGNAGGPA